MGKGYIKSWVGISLRFLCVCCRGE